MTGRLAWNGRWMCSLRIALLLFSFIPASMAACEDQEKQESSAQQKSDTSQEGSVESETAPNDAQLRKWTAELGSEDDAIREAAERGLLGAGKPAIEVLYEFIYNEELECVVRRRAAFVRREIKARSLESAIIPGTTGPFLLNGAWNVISFRDSGKEYKEYVGTRFEFAREKMIITEKNTRVTEHFIRVDTTTTPHQLDSIRITSDEAPALVLSGKRMKAMNGIFELDGDTLKWCRGSRSATRPNKIESVAGDDKTVILLERSMQDG